MVVKPPQLARFMLPAILEFYRWRIPPSAPSLVLEECPNTGNVPIAESSQTLQMNEAAGDDRGVQLASLLVKNEALVFVVQSSPRLGLLVALDLNFRAIVTSKSECEPRSLK